MIRTKRRIGFKLLVPTLLALLPLLTIGSGLATTARAGAPTNNATGTTISAPGDKILVLQVYFRDKAERDRLATDFGAEEVPTTGGFLTIIGDRDTANSLLARGLRVEIDQQTTNQLNDPDLRDTFYGGYKTVEEIYTFLDQKVAAYPTLAEKLDIGDSWCKAHPGLCIYPQANNGYDLFVLHITNRNIAGPKPVFWFDSGIHSREIATPEVAMRYINFLLDSYNTNADARWLVDYHDIWIMPSFNPDGHHIVETPGEGTPFMYRKNGNNSAGSCSIPPNSSNHYGVDNNRNFPFLWGCCGGSTTAPCAQTYRGVSANSEDETQAVTAKISQLIPDQRGPGVNDPSPITTTGVYQNLHSVAELNLYSWGWTSNSTPNETDIRNIGAHMGALNAGGNGYQSCTTPECLYIVDGAATDWGYGDLGIPSYTTELGGSGFLPAYAEVEVLYNENKGMLTYLSKIARTPYLTTRGPDANNVPTAPITVTVGSPAALSGTMNYAWTNNLYAQNVAAAEYYIDTPPWAGGTPVAMNAVDGAFDEQTEPVQATISTGSLTLGRHIIFVRGRGVNNYQGFQSWGPISAAFLDVVAGGTTPTVTSVPPTGTSTAVPPTSTSTAVPPTSTSTRTATTASTSTATNTVAATSTETAISTATTVSTATTTPCTITFTDVGTEDPFYANIQCLACRDIVSGYSDGTFRPNNPIIRGQIAKMVSNSAGFSEDPGAQIYTDVDANNPFYAWINRLSMRGHMGGYPCGGSFEPCDASNRSYFRPFANATRGQLSKIVANAAGIQTPVPAGTQTYTDVPSSNPFYVYIERLTAMGVMSGYPCGGPGEPCDSANRPYFRPFAEVTRGQASKIVANTFFPNCETPVR